MYRYWILKKYGNKQKILGTKMPRIRNTAYTVSTNSQTVPRHLVYLVVKIGNGK
jgi:hypothetical protein